MRGAPDERTPEATKRLAHAARASIVSRGVPDHVVALDQGCKRAPGELERGLTENVQPSNAATGVLRPGGELWPTAWCAILSPRSVARPSGPARG